MNPKNKHLFLFPLLLGSLFLVLLLLILKPKIEEIISLSQQLEANRQKLSFLTEKLAMLKRLDLDNADLKDKTEKVLQLLPSQNDPANLLTVFRLVAQENQVTLGEIKATPGEISMATVAPTKKTFSESSFNLLVEGELTQVKNFIGALATIPPLMKVEVDDLDQDAKSQLTKANLLITAYYLPLPEKIDSVDKPLPQLTASEEKTFLQLVRFRDFRLSEKIPSVETGKTNPFSF